MCSLVEQKEIVVALDQQFSAIDAIDEQVSTQVEKAEALRQSILKKAFSGQLVPQDPNDEPASVLLERIKAEKAQQKPKTGKKQVKRKATAG